MPSSTPFSWRRRLRAADDALISRLAGQPLEEFESRFRFSNQTTCLSPHRRGACTGSRQDLCSCGGQGAPVSVLSLQLFARSRKQKRTRRLRSAYPYHSGPPAFLQQQVERPIAKAKAAKGPHGFVGKSADVPRHRLGPAKRRGASEAYAASSYGIDSDGFPAEAANSGNSTSSLSKKCHMTS